MQWVIFLKNAFIISGVFISGLIGAGFATGSEIYFYFSRYANKGYLGIVLSSFLFALLQYEIITQSHRLSAHTIDEYLSKIMPKGLAAITGVFTYVFMLFILSAMLSGFGEMLYYLWGIKKSAGALIMLLVTAFIISKGYNKKEKKHIVTNHAEIIAIEKANKKLKTWHLDECELYTTLEPCMMCSGAIIQSRIKKVYCSIKNDNNDLNKIIKENKLKIDIEYGICKKESLSLIQSFFNKKRK